MTRSASRCRRWTCGAARTNTDVMFAYSAYGSGAIDGADLAALLQSWGACP
jgi:hypothetical protein